MKKIIAILLTLFICLSFVACGGEGTEQASTPEPTPEPTPTVEKIETVVEITKENFNEYFKLVKIENPVDNFGDPANIGGDLYIVTSNVYDKGLVLYDSKDAAIKINGNTLDGGLLFWAIADKGTIPTIENVKGTAVFVNSEFVESYEINGHERKVTFKDGKKSSREISPFTFEEEYPY